MSLTNEDNTLKLMKGTPVLIDDICAVYSPTIGEIVELGYSNFLEYISIITSSIPSAKKIKDKELIKVLEGLTDFQYLIFLQFSDPVINSKAKEAFRFFLHDNVTFSLSPAQIIIGPLEEKHIMTEEVFYRFRKLVKQIAFMEHGEEEIIIYADDSRRVKSLKRKMIEGREARRIAKAKKAAKEKTSLNFSDLVGSITINHCGLNILSVWDVTYYGIQDQLERMGWRDQLDTNTKAALAGAKIDKKDLKHWIRSMTE